MNKVSPDKNRISPVGVLVTAAATLGFMWAGWQWHNRHNWPPKPGIDEIKASEVSAFENLLLLAEAQERYRRTDVERLGKKGYARFLVHLYKSVDKENKPVSMGLIPRRLAFASGRRAALDGYYYRALHQRFNPEKERTEKIDYAKQWAHMALFAEYAKTGRLAFVADNNSGVFAKQVRGLERRFPHDPLSNGWTKIDSVRQLQNLQKNIDYQKADY